ncbi:Ig-like domain-containing protein [Neobacillus niacini]|uniref:rhamnogalacturonan lyase family protein n=1 Tax=Neobacillus niacini TaxID=86668 RepID=UPI002FFF586D
MGKRKKKILMGVLSLGLVFSNLPFASATLTDVDGYQLVDGSDFEENNLWGFTAANSTVSINEENIKGNATDKLQYTIVNQSGGRVATKNLETAVKGKDILVQLDWYPGKNNDKGSRQFENSGELRIIDSTGNTIFTLNNTNTEAIEYFAGSQAPAETFITNQEAWYEVRVHFDLINHQAVLTLTDKASGESKDYTSSLEGVAFDGSVKTVKLVGIRTSGNNHSWTTYLDDFGVYNVPIPSNTISKVDQLRYHHVKVNETTSDLSSIGLPETVTVTLADNSKKEVAVSEWKSVGKEWNPEISGVYEFKGILAGTKGIDNSFNREATFYVYNRLPDPGIERQTEWLDRGVVALKSDNGIFVSWRLLADEYAKDVTFNVYRNGKKVTSKSLNVTNYQDAEGSANDTYTVETLVNGQSVEKNEVKALAEDYLSIPMQKPEGGTTATGDYTYTVNDSSVGDLDGDGELEVIVKWYPTNAIDSSQTAMTGPTIFDAYKLDGTLLWRINMGLNLTSGAHYHQFIVADFDGNGKSDFLIKTADGTTAYGVTDGKFDSSKVLSEIGIPEDNGKWLAANGHIIGGPEYISVFNGETGEVIDTIDYAFPLGDDAGASWGDTWQNRSDRFLAGLAYLDGKTPSAIYGRGYYERTSFVAYSVKNGKLVEEWTFDSNEAGRGASLGNHNLATADVDNDGFDEIIAGSLTLDHDGSILYTMDGEMQREKGSHGDALHVGAFDPDRDGLQVFGVHEEPAVASLELHDAATGETFMSYFGSVDAGRGVAANISSEPGYEFWGWGGNTVETGGGIYNVQGKVVADSSRNAGLSANFALYWDGDLQHELLDDTVISKYNESTGKTDRVKAFKGVHSNNGTKATPTLQGDILGDWREEVLLPTTDDTELRVYSTTIPTEYRLYTFMHDAVYRNAIAWQNTAYNQPPHIGFYLGEDIRERILVGELQAPGIDYTATLPSMKHTVVLELNESVLINSLDQVQHMLSDGKIKQAVKHMENFKKHLTKAKVDEGLKTKLLADADQLMAVWTAK